MQGALQPHRQKFAALRVPVALVRSAEELATCDGLVLPGGESTTLLNLISHYRLWEPILEFAAGKPVWGVCAGAILMAERVENPAQESLGLIPITIRRNAYGRQNESFIAPIRRRIPGTAVGECEGVFIRAPRITHVAAPVRVVADHAGDPVAVQHDRHLVTTFHPELSVDEAFHAHFLALCRRAAATLGASPAQAAR